MNSKLAIIANGRERALPQDASISVELNNPLFNDTEMFSYPIPLPIEGNRDMLKNVDDVNSDLRPISFEHTPMRIIADGMPFASGPMVISEDERLDGVMSVSIDSAVQDFDSMIADLNCNDISIPEEDWKDLIIGEKISNVTVEIKYIYAISVLQSYSKKNERTSNVIFPAQTAKSTFEPQALGFSYPAKCEIEAGSKQVAKLDKTQSYRSEKTVNIPKIAGGYNYINVTDEYGSNKRGSALGGAKFCNARVCYKHYAKGDDGTTSDNVILVDDGKGGPEDRGPYWVLDAQRPQSGICFYVLYFLECLFKHLGMNYDIDALLSIEDMKHLCFFTTKCSYRTQLLHYGSLYTESDAEVKAGTKKVGDVKEPYFSASVAPTGGNTTITDIQRAQLFTDVNKWLESRGCGGRLELEALEGVKVNEVYINNNRYVVGENYVEAAAVIPALLTAKATANISNMIADEGNFPEMSVSSLLESLENMFGIKFSYDYEQNKVTAYLLRDVFCKPSSLRPLHAEITGMVPMTEKITGVRVGYSAEADAKEQRDNVKKGVKDYDTSYDYIDYPDPANSDTRKTTIIDKTYSDIFYSLLHTDENTYIDQQTGNAYRIKINSDYTDVNDMEPRLFEVGQFHCVEEGDCSAINEDFVVEMLSDLTPIDFNDVNYSREKNYVKQVQGTYQDKDGITHNVTVNNINMSESQPLLAAFVDEDMEHEFVEQRIRQNLAGNDLVNAYLTEVLNCVESYDPTGTDDGNSPLQHYDWENAIALMRGGGNDSKRSQYDSNYDGFGNNKWRMSVGTYALGTDSLDAFGEMFDYNGTAEGGFGEHFSLKPRAYKQPSWAATPLCVKDDYENGERIRIRTRGYVDTFLTEYIYFLLHRKKYLVTCFASIAQIADIPNHWNDWWNINGKRCLINRVSTDISVDTGIGQIEMEVYSL